MYIKKIVDEVPAGELTEVVVTTQKPWYMGLLKAHNIWFPSGQTKHGLRPSRYVAFYEVGSDQENPKTIAYIAKNLIIWNRVTLAEAERIEEFAALLADPDYGPEVRSWYESGGTFHFTVTAPPVKLTRPLPLGNRRDIVRVLSKRKCSFASFVNAETIDDLF